MDLNPLLDKKTSRDTRLCGLSLHTAHFPPGVPIVHGLFRHMGCTSLRSKIPYWLRKLTFCAQIQNPAGAFCPHSSQNFTRFSVPFDIFQGFLTSPFHNKEMKICNAWPLYYVFRRSPYSSQAPHLHHDYIEPFLPNFYINTASAKHICYSHSASW